MLPERTVAASCSSRGIANHPAIVTTSASARKERRLRPFFVPAMGSHVREPYQRHGEELGLIRGAPRRFWGDYGCAAPLVEHAGQAGHTVPITRVKRLTGLESGALARSIQEMLAAGPGLQQGASVHDDLVFVLSYARVIASASLVCQPTPHFPTAPTKEGRPAPMWGAGRAAQGGVRRWPRPRGSRGSRASGRSRVR